VDELDVSQRSMRPIVITRHAAPPYRFLPPFSGQDYALLIYVAAADVSPDDQAKISEEIVASGCRYAVCYGHRCSTWDDSIDLASIAAGKEEKGFVMTTWHEEDSLEEVVEFFWWNTAFDDFIAERMGVFFIGSNPETESEIAREIAKLNEPKKANQALEPTTMAVTSRAPSSTSRASHGRGSS